MFRPAAVSTQIEPSTDFQWGDARIGAGFTLGIVLLIGGAGAAVRVSRQSRRPSRRAPEPRPTRGSQFELRSDPLRLERWAGLPARPPASVQTAKRL